MVKTSDKAPKAKAAAKESAHSGANLGFEAKLWLACFADLDYATAQRLSFSLEPSVESATSASDRALEVEP